MGLFLEAQKQIGGLVCAGDPPVRFSRPADPRSNTKIPDLQRKLFSLKTGSDIEAGGLRRAVQKTNVATGLQFTNLFGSREAAEQLLDIVAGERRNLEWAGAAFNE